MWRYLYDSAGTIRLMRLVVTLVAFIVLAFFGTLLLFVTPAVSDTGWVRTAWVVFAVAGLKLPLILLLWHFVWQGMVLPSRGGWDRREAREILARIEMEAARAVHLPDGRSRLEHLSREAWWVADACREGDGKVDALTVALRVDEARARLARTGG